MISGMGSLPSWSFVILDGEVYDADQYWRDNASKLKDFGKPQEMVEIDLRDPDGKDWQPVELDFSAQVANLGLMDPSAMRPPEGYNDYLTYIEDWTLENWDKCALKETIPLSGKIETHATDVFDFLMEDKKDSMSVEEWYEQRAVRAYEGKRAEIAERRMNRGMDVDPEDLLVTIGDRKLRLDEIATISNALCVADNAAKNMEKATKTLFAQAEDGAAELSDWSIQMRSVFELLGVKKALARSDVSVELANKVYERYVDAAVKKNEKNYAIDCKINAMTGKPNLGFRRYYDLNPGTHSLADENSFVTDIWKKLSAVDVSTDASIQKDFGEFASWYRAVVTRAFSTGAYAHVDGDRVAAEYQAALYRMKNIYGI